MPEIFLQPQIYLALGAFLCLAIAFGILKRLVKFAVTCTMLLGFGLMSFLMISDDPAEDLKRIREGLEKSKEKVEEVKEVVEEVREAAEKAQETVKKIQNVSNELGLDDAKERVSREIEEISIP